MIGFAGLTHLGIVSCVAAASKGFQTVAFDLSKSVCDELSQGNPPVFEPGLDSMLQANATHIRFTSDPAELRSCKLVYISLDVPTDDSGLSNLSKLNELIDIVISNLGSETILVLLSQVKPGYTRSVSEKIRNIGRQLDLFLFHQVETLIIGTSVERALHPDRFIVGCPDTDTPLPKVYSEFLSSFDCPIIKMGYESAEITKIAVNVYLASSVTVSNCLSELCASLGGEWSEVTPALKLDTRIGPNAYLNPGLGISGGHLERDLATVISMASEVGSDAGPIETIDADCRRRQDQVLRLIHSQVISKDAKTTIGIWGLAYKPGTRSTMNSPSLRLIDSIREFTVQTYDPQAVLCEENHPDVIQSVSCLEACRDCDVLAVMTPWPEFAEVDMSSVRDMMSGQIIIDPFGILNHNRCSELGFSYFRLGSPNRAPIHSL